MSTVATRKDDKFFDFPWLLTDHKPISTVHISPVFNKYNVILEKKKKKNVISSLNYKYICVMYFQTTFLSKELSF